MRKSYSESNPLLQDSTFYILLSLLDGPKHGYAIMKDVRLISEQRVVLSAGTLYGALKRLLDLGWVERTIPAVIDEDERDRKEYRLTEVGRKMLEMEVSRHRKMVAVADLRLSEVKP